MGEQITYRTAESDAATPRAGKKSHAISINLRMHVAGRQRRRTGTGADDGGADVEAVALLCGYPALLDRDEAPDELEELVGVEGR